MVMKLAAEQASTSGTAINFTGIPAGTSMIVIMFDAVSFNGSGHLSVRLGTSGGVDSTAGSYKTRIGYFSNAGSPQYSTADTANFLVSVGANADNVHHSKIILTLEDATNNVWSVISNGGASGTTPNMAFASGTKALSAVLDRVQILSSGGDTFDAGAISIAYF